MTGLSPEQRIAQAAAEAERARIVAIVESYGCRSKRRFINREWLLRQIAKE